MPKDKVVLVELKVRKSSKSDGDVVTLIDLHTISHLTWLDALDNIIDLKCHENKFSML
jgi:hypothetical protein